MENSNSTLEYLPDLLDSLQITCDRPECPALHPSGSQCPPPLATNASNDRSGPVRISVARRQLHKFLTATGLSAENAAGYKKKRRVVQGMGRRAGSGGGWPSDGRSVEREARPMGHRTGFWGFWTQAGRFSRIRTHASSLWAVLSAESETETAIYRCKIHRARDLGSCKGFSSRNSLQIHSGTAADRPLVRIAWRTATDSDRGICFAVARPTSLRPESHTFISLCSALPLPPSPPLSVIPLKPRRNTSPFLEATITTPASFHPPSCRNLRPPVLG